MVSDDLDALAVLLSPYVGTSELVEQFARSSHATHTRTCVMYARSVQGYPLDAK